MSKINNMETIAKFTLNNYTDLKSKIAEIMNNNKLTKKQKDKLIKDLKLDITNEN